MDSWGQIQMSKQDVLKGMAVLAALTFGGAGSLHATVIFSTGENVSSGIDNAWKVVPADTPTFLNNFNFINVPNAYVVQANSNFPFGFWAQPLTGSNWITPIVLPSPALTNPNAAGLDQTSNGFYQYYQTFTATAAGSLVGQFLSDNTVTNISLKDLTTNTFTSVSYPGPGSDGLPATPFSAPLKADTYLLSFFVENFAQGTGNPTGLDVLVGTTSETVRGVPELSTWAMMIVGFASVGFVAYRRKPGALRLA
jgi:hypothetical protein